MEVSRWKCRLVWRLPQVVLKSRSSTFLNEDIVLIWWEPLTFSLYGYTFSRKKFGLVVFIHKPWLNVLKFDTWRGDHLLTLTASQVTLISLELIEKSFSGHSYFTFLILQSVGSNLGSWILILSLQTSTDLIYGVGEVMAYMSIWHYTSLHEKSTVQHVPEAE